MKKIFSISLVCLSALTFAQISVSGKANMLFPSQEGTWKNFTQTVGDAYESKGENNAGYNFGISVQIDTPANFFVMPELYYTTFRNKFYDDVTNTTIEAKSNRVDLPVLLGWNVLGKTLGIFAGPVASYNLSTDNQYNDFKENAKNEFTVGYQLGAQAKIKKLIVNARYEGAFTEDQREFVSTAAGSTYTVRYDNRPSLFILGLGYQF